MKTLYIKTLAPLFRLETNTRQRRINLTQAVYRWHRRIGVSAILLVLLLASTGIALNHGDSLSLDQNYVQSDLLLDWYGIQAPDAVTAYHDNAHWVSQLGSRVYLDERELSSDGGRLLGAVTLSNMLVVALESEIILLSLTGEIIERLHGAEGVPAGIQKIGSHNGVLVVQASHGIYRSDPDVLNWNHRDDISPIRWAQAAALPAARYETIATHYRGKGLTLERFLLDLHSGRVFGEWGVWLMDAAAITLILLSFSGGWFWWRRQRTTKIYDDKSNTGS